MLLNKSKFILATTILSMCLTGCGNKSQSENDDYEALVFDYNLLQEDYNTAQQTISSLEEQIKELSGVKEDNGSGIDGLDLDNKSNEFTRLGSKLKFDTTLKYTDAYQAPNTSRIMLADKILVDPSNNWVIEMDGTSTRYNHPEGIVGEITIENIDEIVDDIFLETEILKPFLDTLTKKSDYSYRVYVGDTWSGMCNTALIEVNDGNAIIKSGIIGKDEYAITYCFYYDGDMNKTKNELIDNLIKSITIDDNKVKIDS